MILEQCTKSHEEWSKFVLNNRVVDAVALMRSTRSEWTTTTTTTMNGRDDDHFSTTLFPTKSPTTKMMVIKGFKRYIPDDREMFPIHSFPRPIDDHFVLLFLLLRRDLCKSLWQQFIVWIMLLLFFFLLSFHWPGKQISIRFTMFFGLGLRTNLFWWWRTKMLASSIILSSIDWFPCLWLSQFATGQKYKIYMILQKKAGNDQFKPFRSVVYWARIWRRNQNWIEKSTDNYLSLLFFVPHCSKHHQNRWLINLLHRLQLDNCRVATKTSALVLALKKAWVRLVGLIGARRLATKKSEDTQPISPHKWRRDDNLLATKVPH